MSWTQKKIAVSEANIKLRDNNSKITNLYWLLDTPISLEGLLPYIHTWDYMKRRWSITSPNKCIRWPIGKWYLYLATSALVMFACYYLALFFWKFPPEDNHCFVTCWTRAVDKISSNIVKRAFKVKISFGSMVSNVFSLPSATISALSSKSREHCIQFLNMIQTSITMRLFLLI